MDQQNQKGIDFSSHQWSKRWGFTENFNLCPGFFLFHRYFSYIGILALAKIASTTNVNNTAGKAASKFQDLQ